MVLLKFMRRSLGCLDGGFQGRLSACWLGCARGSANELGKRVSEDIQ